MQPVQMQEVGILEVGDRFFDIFPRRVLRKYRSNHDFQRRVAWPPLLGTVMLEQLFKDGIQGNVRVAQRFFQCVR